MNIKYISETEQNKLEKLFVSGAEGLKIHSEYWAHGGDEGLSYCYECCKKEIRRLRKEDPKNKDDYLIDGGWGTESDSIAYCDTCRKLLENTLTDYGSEEEVDHFLEYGFDLKNQNDCYSMDLVINGHGWRPWTDRKYQNESEKKRDLDFYKKLHILCRQILNTIPENTIENAND